MTLTDPNLPAGAIIKELDNGGALRNDGVRLKPANENPWYVLATVFGEQEGVEVDRDLHGKNRRIWNGWACQGMSPEERAKLANKMALEPAELADLNEDEQSLLEQAFKDRLGADAIVPDSDETVDFSKTHFVNTLVFTKCVVAGPADFVSATFSGYADFVSATFGGPADFVSATFSGGAYFGSATFSGYASFDSVTFSGDAWFGSATFGGPADFVSATFSGGAVFISTEFESATRFDAARFLSAVPQFHAAKLYDNTTFFLPGNYRQNWPPLSGTVAIEGRKDPVEVMPAAEQKRAYNRLRLFYNKTLQVEEEQFFHRREMACKREMAGGLMRGVYGVYDVVSDYGYSVGRPALGLFALWQIGLLIGIAEKIDGVATLPFVGQIAGWSFANIFPFFGFRSLYFKDFEVTSLMAFVGGSQTVLGFILLFFLGLGLRNRFRLR